MQRYQCKICNYVFLSKRKKNNKTSKDIFGDYIFHKQTFKELQEKYGGCRKDIQELLRGITVNDKIHNSRPVHIIVDATYFGEQKEGISWCVLVARDPYAKENLSWVFADNETTYGYVILREKLELAGYTILSVTGDGFSGIRSAFNNIPFQMCHVHMERLIIKGTTRKPLTEAGRVLLSLVRTLHEHTNSNLFTKRLRQFGEIYEDFLKERTVHPLTGDWSYTHDGVRTAYLSLVHLRKYLFTYEHNNAIPKTTNSLEGHFCHIKKHLGMHGGLSQNQKQKILAIILQASSVSPNKKTLNELWK